MSGDHFLELGKNPVHFDPVGAVTNVFFDESNTQVSIFLTIRYKSTYLYAYE